MSRPALAAITLDPRGGGIAAVSRLLWQVVREDWPDARLHTLVPAERAAESLRSGLLTRGRFGMTLAALQATGGTDWVVFSHLALADVQRVTPRPFRRPYAVFLHDVEAWEPLGFSRRRVLAGAALRLANSRFTARRVMQTNPDVGLVEPCPLALPGNFTPHAHRHPGRLGPHVVLTVGRMESSERYKGHDQLLEAWPGVIAQVPDARLVMAGTGDDLPRLRAAAAARDIAPSVVFTGFVPDQDLSSLYASAAVFAMPSRREGFGLVYLEAMASGLPCIGSTHDASGEIIVDDETGYLVDQSSIPDLTSRLVCLLRDRSRREAMGDAGRSRVHTHFSRDHFARRFTGLVAASALEPIVARPSARPTAG